MGHYPICHKVRKMRFSIDVRRTKLFPVVFTKMNVPQVPKKDREHEKVLFLTID